MKHKTEQTENDLSKKRGLDDFFEFLKRITPIPDNELERIFPFVQFRQVKKNDFLLREGEVCRNVYFLTKGFFRMFYVDYEGNEINYRFAGQNNFLVDFQSFLTQKPAHFFWQAMQDAEVFGLPYQEILNTYAVSPAWNNFGRLIAEHVYLQLNERVEMLLFMSPEERYKHLLDTRPDLFEQVSQFHLSSYMGIKPESLSRLRKRMLKK